MSWKTLNTILGLAAVDEEFCRSLLENPLQAVASRNVELTMEENAALKTISAKNLSEFSQKLVALLRK